jgi:hypothetical protein
VILLPSSRQRIARVPFLFRAHDCLDEIGMFALSYGQKVYATFTRAGRGAVLDQNGRVLSVPNGMPRITQLYTGSARVPALLLEGQVDNLAQYSEDFSNAAWTKSGVTVTPNATTAPDGTLTGDLLTAATTGSLVSQTIAFTANSRKAVKIFLKEFSSSAEPQILLFDSTAPADRHRVRVQWVAGVPVLTTVAGAGYRFTPRPAGFGWWEVEIAADGVIAANTNQVIFYPDRNVGTGATYFWGAQAENAGTPGSYVRRESAAASQAAETCEFPFRMLPAALSAYYAGVDVGLRVQAQLSSVGYHLWTVTNAAGANPQLKMNCFSGNGRYQFQRTLASGTQITAAANADPPQPDPYEAFEMRGRLYTPGNIDAGLRSASESAETTGTDATTSPLDAAWAGEVLYLNQGTVSTRFRSATRALAFADGALSTAELAALCEVG